MRSPVLRSALLLRRDALLIRGRNEAQYLLRSRLCGAPSK
jgi:hypothetical protein